MNLKNACLLLILSIFSKICIATVFYVDPVNGSDTGDGSYASPWQTLEQVVTNNLIESLAYVTPYDPDNPQIVGKNIGAPIQPGDTIMLYSGMHGEIFLRNYINNDFITIKAVSNNTPILKKIHFQGGEKWRLEGLTISSEPYGVYINEKLIHIESHGWQGPVSLIDVTNCHIYSTSNPWTSADEWVTKASNGIMIIGDSINIINNTIENIRMGINMRGNFMQVSENSIVNFSGDGIRILGSNNLVESNIIKNCYAVDENHDDGIQSFALGVIIVDNNIVRRNTILNYEDPNQPLLGSLQGIGCFDGFYNNWIVENNLIIVDHWHGISFYGANNCHIINNTVLDPSPDITPGPSWIKIEDLDGIPSANCVVKNNVSNSMAINPNSNTTIGNNTSLITYNDYGNNFIDYVNNDFHLSENSILIDNADMSVSPNIDLDEVLRPQGDTSDIGAYEYVFPLSSNGFIHEEYFSIYPNPSTNLINIDGESKSVNIKLFDTLGKEISSYSNKKLPFSMDVQSLTKGIYFVQISNSENLKIFSYKIIKN